eukprot:3953230-Pleurochrysis_carterae.AAC.1
MPTWVLNYNTAAQRPRAVRFGPIQSDRPDRTRKHIIIYDTTMCGQGAEGWGSPARWLPVGGAAIRLCRPCIQSLKNGALRAPQVRMRREYKMGNCVCGPKAAARCDGFEYSTSRRAQMSAVTTDVNNTSTPALDDWKVTSSAFSRLLYVRAHAAWTDDCDEID